MQKNFSYLLEVEDISPAEKEYNITATPAELAQITAILKVPEVKSFAADIFVRRRNKSTLIDVRGSVKADIVRQSVISLEYFDKNYAVDFDLQFDTALNEAQVRELEESGAENIPDVIIGGHIDLCQLALEQIALNLEDYPRKKGESFNFVSEFDEDDKPENPFKILEKLKK